MTLDPELVLEAELAAARRQLSKHLFHYTSAEAAITGILSSGTLRLSPFESTNDLWESRPLHPGLSLHDQDREPDSMSDLWNEIDRNIRLHAKVVCLTQDWDLDQSVLNPDALRGWAHLSLWAHYGASHRGICLRFDRDRLLEAFMTPREGDLMRHHGEVEYRSTSIVAGAGGIDIGQIGEFGVDAVATNYAMTNRDSLFLRKSSDWKSESEYRLVLLNQSLLPSHFDIRDAMSGVFLGESFPDSQLPALLEVLGDNQDVEVHKLLFSNRRLLVVPFAALSNGVPDRPQAGETVTRAGDLRERLQELAEEVAAAAERRSVAKTTCVDLGAVLRSGVEALRDQMSPLPAVTVEMLPRITAVPVAQRSRAPGVPGERVHFEFGYICIVENLPAHSWTLVMAIALQVLDDSRVRIHALIEIEQWLSGGNERDEVWRSEEETDVVKAPVALAGVLAEAEKQAEGARLEFDRSRGQ